MRVVYRKPVKNLANCYPRLTSPQPQRRIFPRASGFFGVTLGIRPEGLTWGVAKEGHCDCIGYRCWLTMADVGLLTHSCILSTCHFQVKQASK